MKVFEGQRTIDGLVVTVDGKPLPEHYEVKQFTTWGFEWTGRKPAATRAGHPGRASERPVACDKAFRAVYAKGCRQPGERLGSQGCRHQCSNKRHRETLMRFTTSL